jgi:hypothetical protein
MTLWLRSPTQRLLLHVLPAFFALLVGACSSPSTSAPPAATPSLGRVPARPQAPAPARSLALQTYYAGTLADKLAVHVCLLATDSTVYGDYYYARPAAGLALLGKRLPSGELRLREFANSAHPERPTAEFRLRLAPDGSLTGTWRTLPPARPRELPVQLHPYQPSYSTECHVQIADSASGEPQVRVANAAVTQLLRLQLRKLVAEDTGDPGTQSLEIEYADQCLLSVVLRDEMVGASVTPGVAHYIFDLCTGNEVVLQAEIDPKRVPALVAEANRRLQTQLRHFIDDNSSDTGQGGILQPEDVAGLRQQVYNRASFESYQGASLSADSVRFACGVEYEAMNSFVAKSYTDAFAPAFSFAEIQSYLLPNSPLRRLATPETAPAGH